MKVQFLPRAGVVFRLLPRVLRRHRLMTAWMGLTGEDPVQLVPVIGRTLGYADLREGFLRLILIEGEFEKEFFGLAERIFPRLGTFFDVGANFGLMTVGMAGTIAPSAKFHLFEPNALLTPIIARSLRRIECRDVRINTAAVSDAADPVSMEFIPSHTGASHVSGSGTIVPSIRLDEYVLDNAIQRVDLMKIDVEGYEFSVLKSMSDSLSKGVVRVIYFEYVQKWIGRFADPDDVLRYLVESGFRVFYCCDRDLASRRSDVAKLQIEGAPALISVAEVDLSDPPEETDLLAVHRDAVQAYPV